MLRYRVTVKEIATIKRTFLLSKITNLSAIIPYIRYVRFGTVSLNTVSNTVSETVFETEIETSAYSKGRPQAS